MIDTKHEVNQPKVSSKNETTNKLALSIIATSMVGTVALTFPFIIMQLRSPLPFMSTPKKKVLAALEEISKRKYSSSCHDQNNIILLKNNHHYHHHQQQHPQRTLRFFDLGSGDGESVLAAGSAGWKATGIELNSTLWAVSCIRRFFSNKSIRTNCNFLWGDLWKYDIREADAVMIFGVKPLMPRIANKIAKECKPGTFVMSYRFCIPLLGSSGHGGVKNDDMILKHGTTTVGLAADLIYDKEEMKIYQLR